MNQNDFSFTVREGSVYEFFKERLVGFNAERYESQRSNHPIINMNDYYFMKDIILIKYDQNIFERDFIYFVLIDEAYGSRRRIENRYKYKVESYDSVSIKLSLVDFNIVLL